MKPIPDSPFKAPDELIRKIVNDPKLRRGMVRRSHPWFFSLYFPNYLTYKTADFQQEMFAISEDESIPLAVIAAFRGAGKSIIMTQSYPIWAVLGRLQKKFVVIASQTQYQARVHLTNIKRELESNELLAKDLGPFVEQREEWGSTSLYIPKYNARIAAISTEQSVRGLRHGPYRPDLIICDDVEDVNSVKTREGRNKTFDWLTREVIPIGDKSTKRIIVGNLLHEDSMLMRLKELVENDEIDGIYRQWPIVKDGKSLWPAKYPDEASIETLRRTIGNRVAFHREYRLEILPDEDQIIERNWIQHYDDLPMRDDRHSDNMQRYYGTYLGIDLAISQKDSADYTAMVAVHVFGLQEGLKVFVDPLIVNAKLTPLKAIEKVEEVVEALGSKYDVTLIVEDVGYQGSFIEQMERKNYRVEAFKPHGSDKRSRLMSVSHLFESRRIFMPRAASEELVGQLVGFGVERHDDLVDALAMALIKVISEDKPYVGFDNIPPPSKSDRPITFGMWDKKF